MHLAQQIRESLHYKTREPLAIQNLDIFKTEEEPIIFSRLYMKTKQIKLETFYRLHDSLHIIVLVNGY